VTSAAVLASLSAVGSTYASVPRSLVIRSDVSVGRFQLHDRLDDAMRDFGKPTTRYSQPAFHSCTVLWKTIGLEMRFLGPGCVNDAFFASATAVGSRWSTDRRLRIGDPVDRLEKLYPGATAQRAGHGVTRWTLSGGRSRGDTLFALTQRRRVAALTVTKAIVDRPTH
jgi:hypothetical protein